MTVETLIRELKSNTRTAKIIYDLASRFLQISDRNGDTLWSGNIKTLELDELQLEIIPQIQEKE